MLLRRIAASPFGLHVFFQQNQSLLRTATLYQFAVSYVQPRTFSHLSTAYISGCCLSTSAYPKFNWSSTACPLEASTTVDPSHCLRALGEHEDKIRFGGRKEKGVKVALVIDA